MQTLFDSSEETPGARGLGLVAGAVARLAPPDGVSAVPHMGWNGAALVAADAGGLGARALAAALPGVDARAYFVHSYAADAAGAHVVATCDYGGPVAAAIEYGLLWATQFHPEKSGGTGLQLLRAFVLAAQHGA
jgi:glutamine amidotransferase